MSFSEKKGVLSFQLNRFLYQSSLRHRIQTYWPFMDTVSRKFRTKETQGRNWIGRSNYSEICYNPWNSRPQNTA